MRNEIFLDFAENPDLAELFSRKASGDKCCLEVHFQVNQISTQGVHGTIEKIAATDNYSSAVADEDNDEMMPTHDEPIMVNIMGEDHEEASASDRGSARQAVSPPEAKPQKSSTRYTPSVAGRG